MIPGPGPVITPKPFYATDLASRSAFSHDGSEGLARAEEDAYCRVNRRQGFEALDKLGEAGEESPKLFCGDFIDEIAPF